MDLDSLIKQLLAGNERLLKESKKDFKKAWQSIGYPIY